MAGASPVRRLVPVSRPARVAALLALAMLVGATSLLVRSVPEVAVTTATTTSGPVVRRIFATGTVQAVHTVQVGSQVSGVVEWLGADFNSIVHRGQVLARLDPSLFQAALDQAKASLQQAQAAVAQAEADLEGLRVAERNACIQLERAEALGRQQLMAQADVDAARIAMEAAAAGVQSGEARVRDAKAAAEQAAAAVNQAAVNLDHTIISIISSPIDGVVIARSIDVGQTVAAAVQAPVLFTIADDLRRVQVEVDVDESDVGGIRVGQTVTFQVASYPRDTFAGTVSQIRLQPLAEQTTTATTIPSSTLPAVTSQVATVVSYPILIDVPNPDERLRPGMTAIVTLAGTRRDHVVRIPNNALTFRPPADVLEVLGQTLSGASAVSAGGGGEPATGEPAARENRSVGAAAEGGRSREVWTYDGKRFAAIPVRIGLADDQWTELVAGAVAPGQQLVTSARVLRRARF